MLSIVNSGVNKTDSVPETEADVLVVHSNSTQRQPTLNCKHKQIALLCLDIKSKQTRLRFTKSFQQIMHA